jgi:phage terminase small subunit
MRGAKPKPTALKFLQGNPGHRPLNEHEPKPRVGCKKPDYLDEHASKVWDRLAPRLIQLGILTELDGATFALFCILEARVETGEDLGPSMISQLRGLASCFGLDPSSRSRIKVFPDEEVDGPRKRYLDVVFSRP